MGWPLVAGAVGLGLGIAGMLRKGDSGGMSRGDVEWYTAQRANQIEQFSTQLAQARAKYQTQLGNFYNYTFGKYMPQAQAAYAGKGLQVSGGAFASALAKKSADFQAQGMVDLANREREDLNTVQDLNAQNYGQMMSGYQNRTPTRDNTGAMMGMVSGQLMNVAMAGMRGRSDGSGQTESQRRLATQDERYGTGKGYGWNS